MRLPSFALPGKGKVEDAPTPSTPDPIRVARERIATAAASLAEDDGLGSGLVDERANCLRKCADAVAAVAFGPQGGNFDSGTEHHYHYHPDAVNRRAPVGFARGEAE